MLNFTGCRILVLGDVMLDRFLYGDVDRISPEAPVPVVQLLDPIRTDDLDEQSPRRSDRLDHRPAARAIRAHDETDGTRPESQIAEQRRDAERIGGSGQAGKIGVVRNPPHSRL